MQALLEQTLEEFRQWFVRRGLPPYRAGQVWRWVFRGRAEQFSQMTDLPRSLREELSRHFQLWRCQVIDHRRAEDGTEKLLLQLADGERIECVLLRDDKGHRTVCLSTQVGCAMGCAFCASGLDGVARNLSPGEILEQALWLDRLLPPGQSLTHVVVMGMGEPLANLEGLLPALQMITAQEGLGIGARRITISTVGLPAAIRRLADTGCPYRLAISLHAPNDQLRSRIIPAARRVSLAAVLEAAEYYFRATRRRLTFEYVLLAGVNDRPQHARQLAARLRRIPCLVNLIPYNPVPGLPFRTPSGPSTRAFADLLASGGLNVKIRFRKGDQIDAACGQLRRRHASGHAAAGECGIP